MAHPQMGAQKNTALPQNLPPPPIVNDRSLKILLEPDGIILAVSGNSSFEQTFQSRLVHCFVVSFFSPFSEVVWVSEVTKQTP